MDIIDQAVYDLIHGFSRGEGKAQKNGAPALAGVIHAAFEDGLISRREVRDVRRSAIASIKAILEMESRIKALCDEFDDEAAF